MLHLYIVVAFQIVSINLVRDKKTGKSKGFAFLCYEDQRSTILAVDNLNGIKVSLWNGKICRYLYGLRLYFEASDIPRYQGGCWDAATSRVISVLFSSHIWQICLEIYPLPYQIKGLYPPSHTKPIIVITFTYSQVLSRGGGGRSNKFLSHTSFPYCNFS